MKSAVLLTLAVVFAPVVVAQMPAPSLSDVKKDIQIDVQSPIKAEGAVPVRAEPHHVLVFQNDYVRVYNVMLPPLDATLLHQHDLPYIYLTLGTTDVINAVAGKPEAHLTLEDGSTRYTAGGFAHIARTDAGIQFHNVTAELAHPQASPRNLGDKSGDRPLGGCPQRAAGAKQNDQVPFEQVVACFESDEVRLDMVTIEGGKDYEEAAPRAATLLIAMSNANLEVSLGGEHAAFLHEADVLWLPAGTSHKVVDLLGTKSKFVLITFKDSGGAAAK
jgi:hypothetical protein